jgi:hypothetical protein
LTLPATSSAWAPFAWFATTYAFAILLVAITCEMRYYNKSLQANVHTLTDITNLNYYRAQYMRFTTLVTALDDLVAWHIFFVLSANVMILLFYLYVIMTPTNPNSFLQNGNTVIQCILLFAQFCTLTTYPSLLNEQVCEKCILLLLLFIIINMQHSDVQTS